MIKKLWIMLIIGLAVFMLPMLQVNAQEDEPIYDENLGQIAFSFKNLFSTYYALTAINRIELNTEYIEITIPQSSYHVPEAGGVDSEFLIYFNDGTTEVVNILSIFGANLYGTGTINLKYRFPSKWQLAYQVETTLVQNITAAPSGYVAAMSAGSAFNYYINTGKFYPYITWETVLAQNHYPTTQWYLRGTFTNIWKDVRTVSIYIPPADAFLIDAIGSYDDAYVIFSDKSYMGLGTIDLEDVGSLSNGYYYIDLEEYSIDLTIDKIIQIYIPLSYTVVPPQFVSYITENATMTFDERVYLIKYYDIDGFYNYGQYATSYNVIPMVEAYPLPDVGYMKFQYYVYPDGTIVDFTKEIDSSYIINGILNLYPYYKLVLGTETEIEESTPDVNTFTNILGAFGWNNSVGYIAILIIITALITIPLIILGVPLLVISIINVAITSFFTYMGLLPMIAVIILYLLWTAMIIVSFRRSDIYE